MRIDEVTYKIQIDESIKFSPAVKKQTQNGVMWDPFELAQDAKVADAVIVKVLVNILI